MSDEAEHRSVMSATRCPECTSERLMKDYDTAEIVCMNCGVVLDEKITNNGPEWRAFTAEQREKRNRVGAPLTFTIHDNFCVHLNSSDFLNFIILLLNYLLIILGFFQVRKQPWCDKCDGEST